MDNLVTDCLRQAEEIDSSKHSWLKLSATTQKKQLLGVTLNQTLVS